MRPEDNRAVSRDPRLSPYRARQQNVPDVTLTPPTTPNANRLRSLAARIILTFNIKLFTTPVITRFLSIYRASQRALHPEPDTESGHGGETGEDYSGSPSFSSDGEAQFHPCAPVSPISSPTRVVLERCPTPSVAGMEVEARYSNTDSYRHIKASYKRLISPEPRHMSLTSCNWGSCAISFSCSIALEYIKIDTLLSAFTYFKTFQESTPSLTLILDLNQAALQCNGSQQPIANNSLILIPIASHYFSSSPCLDILQAAAEAAGLDGDDNSVFSIDSPEDLDTDYDPDAPEDLGTDYDPDAPYDPESPPFPISKPNRKLLDIPDMPKTKSKGQGDESPPKASRNQGNMILGIKRYVIRHLTIPSLVNIKNYYLSVTIEPPAEDFLDMSGVQEEDDLDNTLQGRITTTFRHHPIAHTGNYNSGLPTPPGDASMNSETGEQADTPRGGETPSQEHYENRQSTPNTEPPQSNTQEKESEGGSDSEGDEEEDSDGEEGVDAKTKAERDLQSDLGKVREAVSMAGGLNSRKPDFEKQKEREGQHVEIVEQWMDFTDETFDELPERPEESTLRRISLQELLPPATSAPVPLDLELDGEELAFVANQRIEFLVLMRKDGDSKSSWGFPCEAQLLKMYNHVRNAADHDLIMDVCLWCRVDQATGIASIMLSTIHLPLFKKIRHEIRIYSGFPGFRCETYSKITFMQKYGVTLYIPKEVAGMNDKRLFKTLFRKYRHLNVRFLILTRTTFTRDHPDKPPHKRSRIGDTILLLDGPALYEVLKNEPEDRKYFLNDGFSVTLKGGIRSTGPTALFASSFASQVISGLPAETMKQAENRV